MDFSGTDPDPRGDTRPWIRIRLLFMSYIEFRRNRLLLIICGNCAVRNNYEEMDRGI